MKNNYLNCCVTLLLACLTGAAMAQKPKTAAATQRSKVDYVNPFIGTMKIGSKCDKYRRLSTDFLPFF